MTFVASPRIRSRSGAYTRIGAFTHPTPRIRICACTRWWVRIRGWVRIHRGCVYAPPRVYTGFCVYVDPRLRIRRNRRTVMCTAIVRSLSHVDHHGVNQAPLRLTPSLRLTRRVTRHATAPHDTNAHPQVSQSNSADSSPSGSACSDSNKASSINEPQYRLYKVPAVVDSGQPKRVE